jgi:hypothetical protein
MRRLHRFMQGAAVDGLLALAAAALVGGLGAGVLVSRHYEPKLASANQTLGEYRNAYDALASGTQQQNAAINALQQAGEQQAKNARLAAQTARGAARPHYDAAQSILGIKPAPDADICGAAHAAFVAELRTERQTP